MGSESSRQLAECDKKKKKGDNNCVVRGCAGKKNQGNSLYCSKCYKNLDGGKDVRPDPVKYFQGRCANVHCKSSINPAAYALLAKRIEEGIVKDENSAAPTGCSLGFCCGDCRNGGNCCGLCISGPFPDDYWRSRKVVFLSRFKGSPNSKMSSAMQEWNVFVLSCLFAPPAGFDYLAIEEAGQEKEKQEAEKAKKEKCDD